MFPLTVRLAPPDGLIVRLVQTPLFNTALAASVVLPTTATLIVAPVCAPPLIAVNAAPKSAYVPLPTRAPDTVTFCALTADAANITVSNNK